MIDRVIKPLALRLLPNGQIGQVLAEQLDVAAYSYLDTLILQGSMSVDTFYKKLGKTLSSDRFALVAHQLFGEDIRILDIVIAHHAASIPGADSKAYIEVLYPPALTLFRTGYRINQC